ncbi:MAG TPA: non-canonical purine NTP pyrophosphatase [Candidatus Saccharimonadales bacterium]|nr:non-canonical purine NTP pyrophosphatase [Candidatus Saccharimonadales bacterium]
MKQLLFVTSNDHKVLTAKHVCKQFDISVTRHNLDLQEIQSISGETIAKHKAHQAFDLLKQPLVVTDDTWEIPGLNGFPGPYMKYVNQWFTPTDFLRLTKPLKDRRIILHQIICYQDSSGQKIFTHPVEGILLAEARGVSSYPIFTIVSFDGGKHSSAEINSAGYTAINNHYTAWHPLCEWLSRK